MIRLGMQRLSDVVSISVDDAALHAGTCLVASSIQALMRSEQSFAKPLMEAIGEYSFSIDAPFKAFADITVRSSRAINLSVLHRATGESIPVAPPGDGGFY